MTTQHDTLRDALLALQESLPHVGKGQTADTGKYKYKYANLETVNAAVLPVLREHGLLWKTWTAMGSGGFALCYKLEHSSGECVEGDYFLPQSSPQEIGSALTYARRYALCVATGLVPSGDDDDGGVAQNPPAAPADPILVNEWIDGLESAKSLAALQSEWEKAGKAGVTGDARVIAAKDKMKAALS
jgi:hypothetical protein